MVLHKICKMLISLSQLNLLKIYNILRACIYRYYLFNKFLRVKIWIKICSENLKVISKGEFWPVLYIPRAFGRHKVMAVPTDFTASMREHFFSQGYYTLGQWLARKFNSI